MGMPRAHLVDGGNDGGRDIGNDPHLAQRQAKRAETLGEEADIGILGAAGEDLVADDDETGGERGGHGWRAPSLVFPLAVHTSAATQTYNGFLVFLSGPVGIQRILERIVLF